MSQDLYTARINIDNNKRVSSGFFIDSEHLIASCHGIYGNDKNPSTAIQTIVIDRINNEEHKLALEILESNPEEDWVLLKLKSGHRRVDAGCPIGQVEAAELARHGQDKLFIHGFPDSPDPANRRLVTGKCQYISNPAPGQVQIFAVNLKQHDSNEWNFNNFSGISGGPLVFDGVVCGIVIKVYRHQVDDENLTVQLLTSNLLATVCRRGIKIRTFENPFVGMRPLEKEESILYYSGLHTAKMHDLERYLLKTNICIVNGDSGVGKSSFLRAALAPWAAKNQFTYVALNADVGVIEDLRQIKSDSTSPKQLIVVDQFEMLIGSFSDQTAGAKETLLEPILRQITHLSTNNHKLVIAIRADREDILRKICQEHRLGETWLRLNAPQRDELTRMIEYLISLSHVHIERKLAEHIVSSAMDNKTWTSPLPVLQEVMRELWNRRASRLEIVFSDYKQLGESYKSSQGDAFARIFDGLCSSAFNEFDKEQKKIAYSLLFELIIAFKIPVVGEAPRTRFFRRSRLSTAFDGQRYDGIKDKLIVRRLLSVSSGQFERTISITHDAIIESWRELRELLERYDEKLVFLTEYEEKAEKWSDGLHDILTARQIQEADLNLKRIQGDPLFARTSLSRIREFIESSRLEVERQETAKRRRQVALYAATALLACALVVTWRLYLSASSSQRDAEKRLAQRYYIQAWQEFSRGYPMRALVFANEAYKRDGNNETAARAMLPSLLRMSIDQRLDIAAHKDEIRTAVYSPDGKRIVTAGRDGAARIWDSNTGKPLMQLTGHNGDVWEATFNRDGSRVGTVDTEGPVRIWDTENGRQVFSLQGAGHGTTFVLWSPDNQHILTEGLEKTVVLWNAATGARERVFAGHTDNVLRADYRPNGQQVVSAGGSGQIFVWDSSTGERLLSLVGHTGRIWSVRYSPDGQRIATAGADRSVRLWDADTGESLAVFSCHTSEVTDATFSPDGTQILSISSDKTARLWNVKERKPSHVLIGHKELLTSSAWSPDGKRVVTASRDKTIRVWNVFSGRQLATLEVFVAGDDRYQILELEPLSAIAFRPDGRQLLSASSDGVLRLWNGSAGVPEHQLRGHEGGITKGAISPDGKQVATAGSDGTARLWDAEKGKQVGLLRGHEKGLSSILFSPDGARIATASWDGTVRLWQADGSLLHTLVGNSQPIRVIGFSPDGTHLISGGEDARARIWNVQTGALLTTLTGHRDKITKVEFSPDGSRVLTASHDSTVRVWNVKTGKLLILLKHPGKLLHPALPLVIGWVFDATFSQDGRYIATASIDQNARIWDATTGKLRARLIGHDGSVFKIRFSPDSRSLVSAGSDHTARIWDVEDGRSRATLEGHAEPVHTIAFSPDGSQLLTGSDDSTAILWDSRTGLPISYLDYHRGSISTTAFSPDGRFVLTTGDDDTGLIWDLTNEQRSPRQIDKLIACYVPFHLDGEQLARRRPEPDKCRSLFELPTASRHEALLPSLRKILDRSLRHFQDL